RQHADHLDLRIRHQLGDLLQPDLRFAARDEHAHAAVGTAGRELDLRRHLGGDAEPLEHALDMRRRDAAAGGRAWPTVFACSSARLSASGDDTSGLGAPLRTAMPMPVRARSLRPATTLPRLMSSSIAALSVRNTSTGSPRSKRGISAPEGA